MRKNASLCLILIPALLVAACGRGGDADAPAGGNSTAEAGGEVEEGGVVQEQPLPASQASGITGIDAAVGDARAMPDDFAGPSPYDLARRKASRERSTTKAAPQRSDATIEPVGTDLIGGDETLTSGG
jgi:hypothetical protein